ncbi:hypothetical protein VY88_17905 [Azospirillum thiophilum]|uniref:Uncharacterized protein n=1 Tax=Azospirillum thiophilum TaxID=528244 RepID=A0AAC8VZZ6_9PROT|nr:hypothetical protein [Azospirillum thiophilum]ALG72512.1 hypothetical protein AL072_15615 [Azospirillum thiophilum]KJR64571.1 hypothetical protein VY88_17905 [Azospirillum thiophilum]
MASVAQKIAFAPVETRRALVYAALSRSQGAVAMNMAVDSVQTSIDRLKRVLFPWMVLDFRGEPTKTKALCIFKMFLSDKEDDTAAYAKLSSEMKTVEQNSKLAKSMSWFKRVKTSKSRTVDSNIFDDMFLLHLENDPKDTLRYQMNQELFAQILRTPPTLSQGKDVLAAVRTIRQTCKEAGFDLKNLGLSDSFT